MDLNLRKTEKILVSALYAKNSHGQAVKKRVWWKAIWGDAAEQLTGRRLVRLTSPLKQDAFEERFPDI